MKNQIILLTLFILFSCGNAADDKIIKIADDEINIVSSEREKQNGLAPLPDLHQTYLRLEDKLNHFWVSGNLATRKYDTNDFSHFTLFKFPSFETAVFGPSDPHSTEFDADYAAPGSVFFAANNTDLIMIYHAENHYGRITGSGPFYTGIGLAISNDGGNSWIRKGEIISGRESQPVSAPSDNAGMGAGNPSAIVTNDGYIYVFFTDSVSDDGPFKGKNQLCLARAALATNGAVGSWTKFYQGSFNQPGLGGLCDQIITNPLASSGIRYSNNPDISFNKALKAYLLVFNSDDGFFYATSSNLIKWSTPKLLMQTKPHIHALQTPGENYYYYPTLISPEFSSDQTTGESGFLFYAKGTQDNNLSQSNHSWFRRSFKILPN